MTDPHPSLARCFGVPFSASPCDQCGRFIAPNAVTPETRMLTPELYGKGPLAGQCAQFYTDADAELPW